MFTDIPQEAEDADGVCPIEVVGHTGGVGLALKIYKAAGLLLEALGPCLHGIFGVQLTLLRFEGGIAYQSGGPTHQNNGRVPVLLEPSQSEQRHEAADVQAICRGIEPAIERAGRA